jgi:hypothetical protein
MYPCFDYLGIIEIRQRLVACAGAVRLSALIGRSTPGIGPGRERFDRESSATAAVGLLPGRLMMHDQPPSTAVAHICGAAAGGIRRVGRTPIGLDQIGEHGGPVAGKHLMLLFER